MGKPGQFVFVLAVRTAYHELVEFGRSQIATHYSEQAHEGMESCDGSKALPSSTEQTPGGTANGSL